jgi:hypothetical protein
LFSTSPHPSLQRRGKDGGKNLVKLLLQRLLENTLPAYSLSPLGAVGGRGKVRRADFLHELSREIERMLSLIRKLSGK